MDADKIREIVEGRVVGSDLFIVEIGVSPANEIEVVMDSDTSLDIDTLAGLSRAIEQAFDRDSEDYHLTVTSAGIGQPLKLLRQYRKLIGKPVEAVLRSGEKITAVLADATETSLTVKYPEKVKIEGKKRPEMVITAREILLSEIKATCEHLTFK